MPKVPEFDSNNSAGVLELRSASFIPRGSKSAMLCPVIYKG